MSITQSDTKSGRTQPLDGVIRVPSDDGSRVVGIIRDGVFLKSNWRSSKHLCRKHNAVGIDKGAFRNYVEPLVTLITVPDKDTLGKEYRISVENFKHFALEDDLGWGPQLFCPLIYWQVLNCDPSIPHQLALPLDGDGGNGGNSSEGVDNGK